jgi:hypothetical protein
VSWRITVVRYGEEDGMVRTHECGQVRMRYPTRAMVREAQEAALELGGRFTRTHGSEWHVTFPPPTARSIVCARITARRIQPFVPVGVAAREDLATE